jgi:hypothetical protein
MSVIKLVGVELEGGWASTPEGCEMGHDGSVGGLPQGARQQGEIRSPALKLTEFEAWFRNAYPSYVNETCGLHVHFSFKKKEIYQQFMTEEYRHELFHRLCLWGQDKPTADVPKRFWDRMAGKNNYCKVGPMVPELNLPAVKRAVKAEQDRLRRQADRQGEAAPALWTPEAQAKASSRIDARYHAVNFCLGVHGTVEIRVLPMFPKVDVAWEAVQQLIEGTEAFGELRGNSDKELLTTVVWEEEGFNGVDLSLEEALSGGPREELLEIFDNSCTRVAAWPNVKAKAKEKF